MAPEFVALLPGELIKRGISIPIINFLILQRKKNTLARSALPGYKGRT
ncbi:hypothetical protein [Phytobacter massiliensis]|nr:hypothetical protein [Phytobacter massiliensis]